ncbi:hypothetical protein EV702DRAFT_1051113 [Suillus placidus]|uniref:Uncharacterized protein n=1 Tax=Suillus placidus TaxID=48579 RepID=A0A9P6ZGY1_9AGAM|nr:hypothetical protein EV702DRAFT_1051113 [Suillus placidus]
MTIDLSAYHQDGAYCNTYPSWQGNIKLLGATTVTYSKTNGNKKLYMAGLHRTNTAYNPGGPSNHNAVPSRVVMVLAGDVRVCQVPNSGDEQQYITILLNLGEMRYKYAKLLKGAKCLQHNLKLYQCDYRWQLKLVIASSTKTPSALTLGRCTIRATGDMLESSKARLVWMRAAYGPNMQTHDGVVSFVSLSMRLFLNDSARQNLRTLGYIVP